MKLTAALALLLWGCGVGGESGAALRFASRADHGDRGVEGDLLERYRDTHPGLELAVRYAATDAGHRERVFAALARGAPPDAFLLDAGDVPALGDARLLDLSPYLRRAGVDPGSFDSAALAPFRRGDAVYALPRGRSPVVIAFNKDLFDRAGLPYPADDWTWDDFLRTARALTRDVNGDGVPDQWGTELERADAAWVPWLWSGGGDVLCAGGRRATGCLDSETSIAALRWYTELVGKERVAPPTRAAAPVDWTGGDIGPLIAGRAAMMTVTHAAIRMLRTAAGRIPRVGFVELPHRGAAAPATALYTSAYAVPRSTLRRKLAIELVASLTDSAAQAARGEAGLDLPAVSGAAQALAGQDSLGWEGAFLRAAADGRVSWGARVAQWRDVEGALADLMDALLAGEDPEPTAHDAARRIDGLLAAAPVTP